MLSVFNSIMPIICLLFIGVFCKKKIITEDSFWASINRLIYYVMFPCLMVFSITKADYSEIDISFIPVLIIIVLLLMLGIWGLKPLFKSERFWVAFIQGSVRYNSYVFIVITLLYTDSNVMPFISLITAFLVMTTNVVSVFILNHYSKNKMGIYESFISTLLNPLVFSCLLGLAINYLSTIYPVILSVSWINSTLNYIGQASLALSLISVGASLDLGTFKKNMSGILWCSLIKLIILPLIVVITLSLMKFDPILILVCMIYAGSPCSSNATAMTQNMGGDYQSMSLIISTQTILSILTLSILLYFYTVTFNYI
ncbi:AEC family transporter [Candidatus Sororendozoicomonas aggregata]|uniref:AEC family transporter n=1 Tax=Candidatus Sororendozoicomonas aggregata TaxID=3073239 RepID=UPI002ED69CED